MMDVFHHRFSPEFGYALSLLTTVVSRPAPQRVIADAGGTAISGDAGLPVVKGRPDLEVVELDAEHIHVVSSNVGSQPMVTEKLELLPTNIDTTTCLHDYYTMVRKSKVEMIVDIPARGKFQ